MTVSEALRAEPVTLLGFGLCGALTGLPPLRLAHAGRRAGRWRSRGPSSLAFALGVVFKIATGGWSKDAELAHPREALHRNPTIGVAFGLTGGVAAFLVFVMNQGVIASLACALIGGVTFGFAFGAIAWSRTMIGLIVAAARGSASAAAVDLSRLGRARHGCCASAAPPTSSGTANSRSS